MRMRMSMMLQAKPDVVLRLRVSARANEQLIWIMTHPHSRSTRVETSVFIRLCASHLGVPEEKCLLQEGVDVSQRGVVHQETQAGLEVAGDDCEGEEIQSKSVKIIYSFSRPSGKRKV